MSSFDRRGDSRKPACCPKFPPEGPVGPLIPAFACFDAPFVVEASYTDNFAADIPNADWAFVLGADGGPAPEAVAPNAQQVFAPGPGLPDVTYLATAALTYEVPDALAVEWSHCVRARQANLFDPLSGGFFGLVDPTDPASTYVGIFGFTGGGTFQLGWGLSGVGTISFDTLIAVDQAWHVWQLIHVSGPPDRVEVYLDHNPVAVLSQNTDGNFPTGVPMRASFGAAANVGSTQLPADERFDNFSGSYSV